GLRGEGVVGQADELANFVEVIARITAPAHVDDPKVELMGGEWAAGTVQVVLELAGQDPSRPNGLLDAFGLKEDGYHLSDVQAQAILDLRLNRLTGLEQDKIWQEFQALLEQIQDLGDILARPERLLSVIRAELEEIRAKYAD